jgi:hypothetical protein
MNIFKKITLTFFLSLAVLSPVFVLAQTEVKLDYSGFVKCDGVVRAGEDGRQTPCDFGALINTIISAINWAFYISIPLAVALFAYAGVLFMTGSQGNIKTAKDIFKTVAVGFIIMITAWFLVRQFVSWFVKDATATTFLGK